MGRLATTHHAYGANPLQEQMKTHNRIKYVIEIDGKDKQLPDLDEEGAINYAEYLSKQKRGGILALRKIMFGSEGNISADMTIRNFLNGERV